MSPFRLPLLRLLAINLAIGIGAAVLMLAGLLALSPQLRALVAHDATAFGLLLFGFVVTFGSVAMGSAVMMLGRKLHEDGGGTPVPVKVAAR
jgi:hypothetical protein